MLSQELERLTQNFTVKKSELERLQKILREQEISANSKI